MDSTVLTIIWYALLLAGGLTGLYGVYFAVLGLIGFTKAKPAPHREPATKFALVVAARNEEAVIGQLVDSLYGQNYPRELFDVYVAPNNCTDNTAGVALRHNARIFTPKGVIKGKGEVLHQICEVLMRDGRYDAMCVFDADNLAHPDFLQKMNDTYQNGARAAQGFRDSKNPADSAISTCYSVCYWMVNRMYNAGRQVLGLSALVNGSGFMVSMELLKKLGGWNTQTMTEDYEFTAQCVLKGERVHYVGDARIYDEQPLTFMQSWKQRRRWSTGSVQGMNLYQGQLVKAAVQNRCWRCADLAITFLTPAFQVISLVLGGITLGVAALRMAGGLLALLARGLVPTAALVAVAFLGCAVLAAVMVCLNRKEMAGTGRGILFFALFLLSWMPISLISLIKPQMRWDAIAHTRGISMAELPTGGTRAA